jgi:hypothetical protein
MPRAPWRSAQRQQPAPLLRVVDVALQCALRLALQLDELAAQAHTLATAVHGADMLQAQRRIEAGVGVQLDAHAGQPGCSAGTSSGSTSAQPPTLMSTMRRLRLMSGIDGWRNRACGARRSKVRTRKLARRWKR